jgi:YtkA-like
MRYAGRRLRHSLHSACVLAAAVILLCVASGCGRMQRADPTTRDDHKVTLAIEPSPAVMGASTLAVTLRDQTGQPVDGARLEVEANMSHAGMVPVLASTAQGTAGVYRVPLEWTMAGDWYVDLTFTLPDGQRVARRYPVQVRQLEFQR